MHYAGATTISFLLLIYSCEYDADLEVTQMLSQAFLQRILKVPLKYHLRN